MFEMKRKPEENLKENDVRKHQQELTNRNQQ